MKALKFFLAFVLLNTIIYSPAFARPGESVKEVLQKYNLEGTKPVTQDDYLSYKASSSRFISQPTIFLKLGAKGIVLEQNFLFDKNTVHEKDVQRAKNDIKPTVAILHQSFLVGDFSQLPRESYDTRSKVIGTISSPFGAAAGTIIGGGKGLFEGTKIGVGTANSASRALGGDISGKAGALASSATAVATGAITGLFAGFTGGAVEGSVRGARFALQGLQGADMNITEAVPVNSPYVVIGGRIGAELSLEEQKDLLNNLVQLEQSRLANEGLDFDSDKNIADLPSANKDDRSSFLDDFDSATDKSEEFDENPNYMPEDSENKNVAGMW